MTASRLIVIPDDVSFEQLKLHRDPGAQARPLRRCAVLLKVLEANHLLDLDEMTRDNAVGGFIISWYMEQRQAGGKADAVAEQIIAEVLDAGRRSLPDLD
jgi:hypothetical protein